ncbi:MAG: DUF6807 domain-containing protein [Planctomycetota bacterium]|jgi:hypothetical protein
MRQLVTAIVAGSLLLTVGFQVSPRVNFVEHDDKIEVLTSGRKFAEYLFGGRSYTLAEGSNKSTQGFLAKPAFLQVRSPSGIVVTRGYPLLGVEGEKPDHPHHVGLFFTYGNVNGNDFWGNTKPSPQVKHVEVSSIKGSASNGKLSTINHWIAKDGQIVLEEKRDMVFISGEEENVIDFAIELTAMETQVEFKDTKEGMFAIRVAHWLRESGPEATGRYLNSQNDEKEEEAWGKRARWLRLEGIKEGKVVGIAILNHPSSVNYPTYWHARKYGLFSANPLGQFDFEKKRNPKNAKAFNLRLEKGQPARFGFRVIVYEGPRSAEQLEEQFADFAKMKLF